MPHVSIHLLRRALLLTALLWPGFHAAWAAETAPRTLLMLDFELIDDNEGLTPFPERVERLQMVSARLQRHFAEQRFYTLLDPAPIQAEIRAAQAEHSLRDCNGCELDLARKLGAERVLVAWVQKVSNLILNLNIEIRDVATGEAVLNKSVDLRGNTEQSWQRGVDFMIRGMLERGQRNL